MALNRVDILPEPLLEFGYGQKLAYPRDGLFSFGPLNYPEQISQIRYGVIGTEGEYAFLERGQSGSINLSTFESLGYETA